MALRWGCEVGRVKRWRAGRAIPHPFAMELRDEALKGWGTQRPAAGVDYCYAASTLDVQQIRHIFRDGESEERLEVSRTCDPGTEFRDSGSIGSFEVRQ